MSLEPTSGPSLSSPESESSEIIEQHNLFKFIWTNTLEGSPESESSSSSGIESSIDSSAPSTESPSNESSSEGSSSSSTPISSKFWTL